MAFVEINSGVYVNAEKVEYVVDAGDGFTFIQMSNRIFESPLPTIEIVKRLNENTGDKNLELIAKTQQMFSG